MIWTGHSGQAASAPRTASAPMTPAMLSRFTTRSLTFTPWALKLQPALRPIPVGGLLKTLQRIDLGPPDTWRAGALRLDHPVAMREISRAVDRQLGLFAAQKLVGAGRKAEQDPWGGDDRGPGSDRGSERSRKLAMGPPARFAVVRLDQAVAGSSGAGQREEEPRKIVGMDHRDAALRRHQHQAQLGHAK